MAIKLLTSPNNYAVCKLEDRNFPGVVFQGDSLFILYGLLCKALNELQENITEESSDSVIPDLEYEIDKLKSIINSYEEVCKKNGYTLPYVRSQL